jgi:hypothetical protein
MSNCACPLGQSPVPAARPRTSCHEEAARPKVVVLTAANLRVDDYGLTLTRSPPLVRFPPMLPHDEACRNWSAVHTWVLYAQGGSGVGRAIRLGGYDSATSAEVV